MIEDLIGSWEKIAADACPRATLRAIEAGGEARSLWSNLQDSGFVDAMLTEAQGGAGLSFAQAGRLAQVAGRNLLPVAFSETMIARRLLADAGVEAPAGPILLMTVLPDHAGRFGRGAVPAALTASHALVDRGGALSLFDLSQVAVEPTGSPGSLAAGLWWSEAPGPLAHFEGPPGGLRPIAAALRACEIAGALREVLVMTLAYADTRSQFGRTISKFQAVQQQLAVAGEQVAMAAMAAEIGVSGGLADAHLHAAVAKQVASTAAVEVAAIAHAVHGAMGISAEYDLQLFTRRLYEWRMADGSEAYWAAELGAARLNDQALTSVDFLRNALPIRDELP